METQIAHRCAWYDGGDLHGAPAPYLVGGTSYCHGHACAAQEKPETVIEFDGDLTPGQAAAFRSAWR